MYVSAIGALHTPSTTRPNRISLPACLSSPRHYIRLVGSLALGSWQLLPTIGLIIRLGELNGGCLCQLGCPSHWGGDIRLVDSTSSTSLPACPNYGLVIRVGEPRRAGCLGQLVPAIVLVSIKVNSMAAVSASSSVPGIRGTTYA